jgi:SnoaL-like protein
MQDRGAAVKPFPSVLPYSVVAPADRASAIDFVNRVNWLFDTWDVDAMVDAFMPESVTYHWHGTNRGRDETRRFFNEIYPYIIPGVSRHATNHIVDPDEDGVVVRYHNLLVRYAPPEAAPALAAGQVMESPDDLPGIWMYSAMVDRLRRTENGWKIFERYVGGTTTNNRLTPEQTDPAYFSPYMPAASKK